MGIVKKGFSAMCLLVLVTSALLVVPALAAQEYVLEEGKIYRVGADDKKVLMEEEPFYGGTDKGTYAWIIADPEFSEGMKGSKVGFYFFDENEKPCGFLPFEGAAFCEVSFSPSGEMIAVNFGADIAQKVTLYTFNGFEKKGTFLSIGTIDWIDPYRFVFTMNDADKGSRREDAEPDTEDSGQVEGWYSAVLYDVAMEELMIIKEATELEDYRVVEIDLDKGELHLLKTSVKNKKDWNEDEKIEMVEFTVPIPAAG